jgi:hypothetical protein
VISLDIIVKGSRDVAYGHKLNLTAGRSGLILDLVIEAGNPADRERLVPMLERHAAVWGAAPRQLAADGGYASRENLAQAKARGVRDMAFHKKSGLRVEDMVRSHWVYRKLRNYPRRHRGGHLLPEARLRPGPLHLARARPLRGLRLVLGRGLQPRALRPSPTSLTPVPVPQRRTDPRRTIAHAPTPAPRAARPASTPPTRASSATNSVDSSGQAP